ncbi:hypothetical protein MJO28_014000 [Puccinia striiformis f. sp. tritici]|uniref:Uncharacterized protein n=1 Tax=Puccinia striiformis f. sp. tritici TaxID=168172 RepID=A0ACC0DXF2_9BASI|nr:hypothetical protein MJO28_014000 [Puccinia striiformis f. sp. tritici]KAI9627494.1 hypothetical protein KEM48_009793 [Puccinia striiformis f. sp. tritici PST-130]
MPNDPKAMTPESKLKGEYHIQSINLTPQFGFQAPIKKEFVPFPNVFVTSGKGIEQLKFTAHKSKKPKVHKQQ